MAKETQAKATLVGRKFAFAGRFGYRDMWLEKFRSWVIESGGAIVSSDAAPDYLVVGEGRGGKPPSEVAKIQARHSTVSVLTISDFARMVLPEPEALARVLMKASGKQGHTYWETFDAMCRHAAATIDLGGADLRQADLFGARLERVNLDGADLRGAKTHFTHFGNLRGVNFDGADTENVYFRDLEGCNLRGANLEKAWLFYGNAKNVSGCDFTGAKMAEARLQNGRFVDSTFRDVELRDAQLDGTVFDRCDFAGADLTRIHAARSRFDGANFLLATLRRADLRNASLINADLRDADLREAALSGADLTGANIEGADFTDAVLTGAKVAGLDASRTKNFPTPVARTVGPKLSEFSAAAQGSNAFETTAEVDISKGHFARLALNAGIRKTQPYVNALSRDFHEANRHDTANWIACPTFEQGMLNLADRWPNATLRLDSVRAKGSRTVRGKKLQELAMAAWAEVFGVKLSTPEELQARQQEQQAEALRQRDALMDKIRAGGAKVWNEIDFRERQRFDLRGIDLSGANLENVGFSGRELQGSRFVRSNLTAAKLWATKLQEADFAGAKLPSCDLTVANLTQANFRNADLTNAKLEKARLGGADFTGAKLAGANLKEAHYDGETKFPAGFTPPESMVWKGTSSRPGVVVTRATPDSIDFDTFFEHLGDKIEPVRLDKAKAMLKAERFALFADVSDDSLVGVVRSQSDKELVYSCLLGSEGRFACCTQNLRPCGGLHGSLCKHLLVLIVGLTKAGKLDPATVEGWIDASKAEKPSLDKEEMTATFLRYKNAEAGEIDWRPTETIPEDYYAL
jgi:uncharacterized protein YjbI with pentapeptide repeats